MDAVDEQVERGEGARQETAPPPMVVLDDDDDDEDNRIGHPR